LNRFSLYFALLAAALALTLIGCGGTGASSTSDTTTSGVAASTPSTASDFSLTSAVAAEGGTLPSDYTCDGTGSSLALSWSNPPAGTKEYALLMTTIAVDGTTKYNWVLYGIPSTKLSLTKDTYGVGTKGVGSDGPIVAYQPPCSQGLGSKIYTHTIYALSASPSVSPSTGAISGSALSTAIAGITLGKASLNLTYNRTASAAGLAANCGFVRTSSASASVGCDSQYAYISSGGLASHPMMNGIFASNLHVPVEQNFYGANGWKIPLNPAIAGNTTSAVDGPIGVAVNGVPIFTPCKQGGCQNGDTKMLGELDACNGHAGRADDYHYHAAPTCLMATKPGTYWDTHPIGWALDGFGIFGYNNADGSTATRDASCGGNTLTNSNAPAGYSYHVTDTSPYVLSCFRGTPSPDLVGQGAKYIPIRKPPVTPFPVSAMTLSTDASDGYAVLKFTSTQAFTSTETGLDSYVNAAGTYNIRYKSITGTALDALLSLASNANKSACWNFQFSNNTSATTQPTITYCR
jgi:phosphatidylethanolamine-binding protein (PEBP) family uncharacterized protein